MSLVTGARKAEVRANSPFPIQFASAPSPIIKATSSLLSSTHDDGVVISGTALVVVAGASVVVGTSVVVVVSIGGVKLGLGGSGVSIDVTGSSLAGGAEVSSVLPPPKAPARIINPTSTAAVIAHQRFQMGFFGSSLVGNGVTGPRGGGNGDDEFIINTAMQRPAFRDTGD